MTRPILAAVLVCLAASSARAEETAAEISRKSRERGALNLVDLSAELKLVTAGKDGKPKEQVVSTTSRKVQGKNCSISRFTQPAPVAGVAFLTIEGKAGEGDEISLYLPKLKRVRKVSRGEKSKSFMDTDFSYSDIGAGTGRDEDTRRMPDQKIDGRDAYVLTGPASADSPYSEVTVYVDKETYVPLKADYKDKDGKAFKVYRTLKLKKFKDRTLAAESSMENLQSGSKTTVTILKLEDSALGDDAFTEKALERG